jgi:broad specificity phosphatase PhoE
MERCFETISPWLNGCVLSANSKFEPMIDPNLNEVDYGQWSGKRLVSLARKKEWKTVQESPSRMYFPGGEGIAAMQSRAMTSVHQVASLPVSIIEYSGIKPRILLVNDTRAVVTDLLMAPKRSKNLLGGGAGK